MAYFLLRLSPPRPTFPHDGTADEMAAMARHADYWQGLAAEGSALLAGPVFEGEGAWGLAIVDVSDETAARSLADADPAVTSGLGFRFDLFPIASLILPPPAAGNAA